MTQSPSSCACRARCSASLVGAALGVAGAMLQGVTRNPLADPGILGINAGAAAFVVVAITVLGVTRRSPATSGSPSPGAVAADRARLRGRLAGPGGRHPGQAGPGRRGDHRRRSASVTTAIVLTNVDALNELRLPGRSVRWPAGTTPILVGVASLLSSVRPGQASLAFEHVARRSRPGRARHLLGRPTGYRLAGRHLRSWLASWPPRPPRPVGPIVFVRLVVPAPGPARLRSGLPLDHAVQHAARAAAAAARRCPRPGAGRAGRAAGRRGARCPRRTDVRRDRPLRATVGGLTLGDHHAGPARRDRPRHRDGQRPPDRTRSPGHRAVAVTVGLLAGVAALFVLTMMLGSFRLDRW